MNRKLLFLLTCLFALSAGNTFAQCNIDTTNAANGFSPAKLACITQNSTYGQAQQLHVPGTVTIPGIPVSVGVDSVKVLSLTGQPAGISYAINPASNTIPGGKNGCVWFSGTSTAAVGNYPLVINVRVWLNILGNQQIRDTTLSTFGYTDTLSVCAAQATPTCDTLLNIGDTTEFYTIYSADTGIHGGYFSGNNKFGFRTIAEKMTSSIGKQVVTGLFWFYIVKDGGTSDSVKVKVWDASGAAGTPGNAIDSTNVPMSFLVALAAQHAPFQVPFPHQPTLTTNDFFVGVVLPTTVGDTVVVVTDTFYTGGPGRGYFQLPTGVWHPYTDATPNGEAWGNFIGAITCGTAANPPVALFTGTPLTGCGSVTTTFTSQSTNTPTSVKWSFPGGTPSTSTAATQTVTYSTAGTYAVTLIATNADGSDTTVKTGYVTVKADVVATTVDDTVSCGASTGTVSVSATGGNQTYAYAWTPGGATTSSVSNLAGGVYTVVVSSNGCSDTATATVVNNSSLTATVSSTPSATTTSHDGVVTVTPAGGTGPYTFHWNTHTSDSTSATVSGLAPGTYNVTVTDHNNCQVYKTVTVGAVSIGIVEAIDGVIFKVSPNPATTSIKFEFSKSYEAEGAVYSTSGQLFQKFDINNQVETINISSLPAGMYVVQIRDKQTTNVGFTRIIKY